MKSKMSNDVVMPRPSYGYGFLGLPNRAHRDSFRRWYGEKSLTEIIGSAADRQ